MTEKQFTRLATDEEQERIDKLKDRIGESISNAIEFDEISPLELLCLMAHLTGIVIALQEPGRLSKDEIMAIIAKNIESGNHSAMEQLIESQGGRQ